MINFTEISNKSVLGTILRSTLSLIPRDAVLPVMQGPNKGFRLTKGSGVNGYWLGSYEYQKQKLMAEYIKDGMVCYDIGAHVGFYTLLFSRFTGKNGMVFSFEPNPINLSHLLKHLEVNKIRNTKIFQCGAWNKSGIKGLSLNSSESSFAKTDRKELHVPVFKIDELVSGQYIMPPDIVKIDVEGAELEVLEGMEEQLRSGRPIIFVALDSIEKREAIFLFLQNLGYRVLNLYKEKIGFAEIKENNEIIGVKDED
ncbi:MAG: FkbM family methyltransferase [Candidatus Omnitrophica bacterium]|nr:FkbM family methyltransferase [Candidatus Omnitrophota bacterium]